jgi:hypothetical protein
MASAEATNPGTISGIRRITATPLDLMTENWRLDMPGISVYPALIY